MLNGWKKKQNIWWHAKIIWNSNFKGPLIKFYWNRAELICLHAACGSSRSNMLSGHGGAHSPQDLESLLSSPLQKGCWALRQAMVCTGLRQYLSWDLLTRGWVRWAWGRGSDKRSCRRACLSCRCTCHWVCSERTHSSGLCCEAAGWCLSTLSPKVLLHCLTQVPYDAVAISHSPGSYWDREGKQSRGLMASKGQKGSEPRRSGSQQSLV